MNLEDQIRQLMTNNLPPATLARVQSTVKESLLLRSKSVPEHKIALANSKLGGRPDLPPDCEWPTWNDVPLAFLAQINLAQLPQHNFLNILPNKGLLSFFYTAGQEAWGGNPEEKESWRVFHFTGASLQRRDFPAALPETGRYTNCALTFEKTISLPTSDSPSFRQAFRHVPANLVDPYDDFYADLLDELDFGPHMHRLLGHPDPIQNDMHLECQLASHGLNCGDGSGFDSPSRPILEPGANDWELLLQIDSDENAGMMWGDCGMLYFMIPSAELKQQNFDAAWMILQCC